MIVVVAGSAPILDAIATVAARAGVLAALVSDTAVRNDEVAVHFRTDPTDVDAWQRVAMHVEQHLGPIDFVVADAESATAVEQALGDDLRRRGRPSVYVVSQVYDTP